MGTPKRYNRKVIKLRACDSDEEHEINKDLADIFTNPAVAEGIWKMEQNQPDVVVYLPVRNDILRRAVNWVRYHFRNSAPLREVIAWENEFFLVDQETLFALISAAHHLGLDCLYNTGCNIVADIVNTRPLSAVRRIFNLPFIKEESHHFNPTTPDD